jgi:CubicO group peptidase (beta-lactamase class C family)
MTPAGIAMASQKAPALLTSPRAVVEQAIAQHAFPGAAWGVLENGAVVGVESAGRFTYEADAPAVSPGTVFDLASVTKVVATTAAAMLLFDRGVLDLDARLGDILPGFVIGMAPGSGKERVTVRMLLAHSAGLVGWAPLFRNSATPDALLGTILRLPLEAVPGTRTEYSDFGFILLGKVIELLAGTRLDVFCGREIFPALGLAHTRFCPRRAERPLIPPTEEDRTFRGRVIQGEVQDEHAFLLSGIAGHAGLFSNVEDLLRFAQCILDGGRTASGGQLFRPETVDLFTTRHSTADGQTRALGWDVPTEPSSSGRFFGARSIGHLGYAGTSLWIDPDQKLAVVLLTNRAWPDRSSEAIRQVRPAFHDAVVESLRAGT